MFKHYFEQIDNVAIYPVFSFLVFFVFFVILGWRVYKMKATYIKEVEQLPLENDSQEPKNELL